MTMSWILFVLCCNFALVASTQKYCAKTCPAACLSRTRNIQRKLQKQKNEVMKAINGLKDDIALLKRETGKLKDKLEDLSGGHNDTGSVILRGEPKFQQKLTSWVGVGKKWKRCWQATKDGWGSKIFHSQCDYKAPTVIIVKVGRYIFGGYVTASWNGTWNPKQAPGSFIFSLRNKENLSPFKAPLKNQNDRYAMFAYPGFGPYIGGGSDLYVCNNANLHNSSFTNFGRSYQPPFSVSDPKTVLAGTNKYTPSEVEVFYIV